MTFSHRTLISCRTVCLAVMLGVFAQAALAVEVKTYGQHVGGNIVYTHEVTNTSSLSVVTLDIGHDTDNIGTSMPRTFGRGEMTVYPVGSIGADGMLIDPVIVPTSFSGPSGWTARIVSYEGDAGSFITWRSAHSNYTPILPGQTATFRITVPEYSPVYLTGHFSARHAPTSATKIWAYNGVMTKLDTVPPTLSVSLTPSTMRAGSKLLSVTAAITVTDNYDPASEIKLESITANQTLKSTDISGATFGTDDRAFKLKPVAGRVYTVTYSATDGSGNKSTASATVTVKK